MAIHARFTAYEFHFFSESEPVSIAFAGGVREFDKLFLLLIFVRMETRRQDTQRRRRRASGANVGTGQSGFVGGI